MARASIPTLLPLDRYAAMVGLNPVHFNGGEIIDGTTKIMPVGSQCSHVFPQFSWQAGDRVSLEDLAQEIHQAEQDIEDHLDFPVAPRWVVEEQHPYPRHHRIDPLWDDRLDVDDWYKGLRTRFSKLISGGVRATTVLDSDAAVSFSDPDGDGYNELATITVAAVTTAPGWGEVKLYHSGHGGDPAYEIRPFKTYDYDAAADTITITLDSWLLLLPETRMDFPTDQSEFKAINILDTADANLYEQTVEVYRVYNDATATSAKFYWNNRTTVQSGVFQVQDPAGFGRPIPASYDAANEKWVSVQWEYKDHEPDFTRLWYYAGDRAERFRQEFVYDPLDQYWADAIVALATARLARPVCSCGNTKRVTDRWQVDLILTEPEGTTYFTPEEIATNPFGTRRGEVYAWKKVTKSTKKRARTALI